MTQDEIIRMAREAGIIFEPMTIDGIEYGYRYVRCSDSIGKDEADCIERFAALVAAHERENVQMVRAITLEEAAQLCMDYGREGFSAHVIARAIREMK